MALRKVIEWRLFYLISLQPLSPCLPAPVLVRYGQVVHLILVKRRLLSVSGKLSQNYFLQFMRINTRVKILLILKKSKTSCKRYLVSKMCFGWMLLPATILNTLIKILFKLKLRLYTSVLILTILYVFYFRQAQAASRNVLFTELAGFCCSI